jgi:hypothetical protein
MIRHIVVVYDAMEAKAGDHTGRISEEGISFRRDLRARHRLLIFASK